MAMFPIDWEPAPSIDRLSDVCPYSTAEIKNYLELCHHRYMLKEAPADFTIGTVIAKIAGAERNYWLLEARDDGEPERQWFVVVGSGQGPFQPNEAMKRWMYAKTNDDGASPQAFLDAEQEDQLAADWSNRARRS